MIHLMKLELKKVGLKKIFFIFNTGDFVMYVFLSLLD